MLQKVRHCKPVSVALVQGMLARPWSMQSWCMHAAACHIPPAAVHQVRAAVAQASMACALRQLFGRRLLQARHPAPVCGTERRAGRPEQPGAAETASALPCSPGFLGDTQQIQRSPLREPSRLTPGAALWAGVMNPLFCFVLFCFVLFCFVLFCFVLFCFVLFCFEPSFGAAPWGPAVRSTHGRQHSHDNSWQMSALFVSIYRAVLLTWSP